METRISLSLSLWIFFHANGTRENRRIISRGRKGGRKESVREFSLFQVARCFDQAYWIYAHPLCHPAFPPPTRSPHSSILVARAQSWPCCNGVSDVFEGARLVALSRHFNEGVEAPRGSGASATPLSGGRGEDGQRLRSEKDAGWESRILWFFYPLFICQ